MQRIEQLDSLRGIAAFIVMIGHYSVLFLEFRNFKFLNLLFSSGSSAVSLFFVLSGFVLSISVVNNKNNSYFVFLIKRFFRLYIPYILSVFLAMFCYYIFSKSNIMFVADEWSNKIWHTPISLKLLCDYLLFFGSFENGIFNPVYWSLVMEGRISLIFFLLIYCTYKIKFFKNILLWIAICTVALFVNKLFQVKSDHLQTFCFVPNFLIGIYVYYGLNVACWGVV